MAVEARHLNFFTPHQLIGNRDIIMNAIEGNGGSVYNNAQLGYGSVPISGTTTTAETLFQMYNNNTSVIVDSFVKNHHHHHQHQQQSTTPMKDDSGLTYTLPPSSAAVNVSRKRSREDNISAVNNVPSTGYNKEYLNRSNNINININNNNNGSLSFLGEDISSQFLLQQLDVDRLISQHMEKVRMEIEESRKRHSRRVIEAVEIGLIKRLRAKEDEIQKIGKMNWALEERVKSLYIENQMWRDLAQSNEATANALRSNLEMVLEQVKDVRATGEGLDDAVVISDDAESCCGSSGGCGGDDGEDEVEEGGWRTLAVGGGEERKVVKDKGHKSNVNSSNNNNNNNPRNNFRWCRKCGKEEACVLLLPCRHLCLCTQCGSTNHTCPICKSNQTASVHVNIS